MTSQKWSKAWKASSQPRKQRLYLRNMPLHLRRRLLSAHLSKELKKKHGRRSVSLRKGDKVKIMRGSHKGREGRIERVDVKKHRVYIEGVAVQRKDGSKSQVPFQPSNLLIQELEAAKGRLKQ